MTKRENRFIQCDSKFTWNVLQARRLSLIYPDILCFFKLSYSKFMLQLSHLSFVTLCNFNINFFESENNTNFQFKPIIRIVWFNDPHYSWNPPRLWWQTCLKKVWILFEISDLNLILKDYSVEYQTKSLKCLCHLNVKNDINRRIRQKIWLTCLVQR